MTDASDGKRDFFISYNRADRAWAEWIAWQLEQAGRSFIVQAWHFRPGHNFVLEMDRAAQTAERTVLVLSPNFLASRFTPPEWAAAFARDPAGEKGLLVPVRVAACDPQGLLGQIVYIDLVGREEAEAVAELLDGLKPSGRPEAPPPFPRAAPTGAAALTVERPARFPGALPPVWNVPDLRNPHLTGREDLLEVPLLVPSSSVAFLLERTRQGDEPTAAALAAELGDLPLALEQAAAFVVRRVMSLADYLAAFRAQREELWRREKPPPDHPGTPRTPWHLGGGRPGGGGPAGGRPPPPWALPAAGGVPRPGLTRHPGVPPPP